MLDSELKQNTSMNTEESSILEEIESPKERKPLWRKLLPIGIGFLFFIFGVFIFFPSERIATLLLRSISDTGFSLSASRGSISPFGKFEFENLVATSESKENGIRIKTPRFEGSISLLKYLFSGNIFSEAKIYSLVIRQGDIFLRGGDWFIDLNINNANKNIHNMTGSVQIQVTSMIAEYTAEVPILNEKVTIPIKALTLGAKLGQGKLVLNKGRINSNLALILLNGELGVTRNGDIGITIKVEPRELFEKYNDKGLEAMLNAFNLIQKDGSLQFNVTGTVRNPAFNPVRTKSPAQ